MTQFSVRVATAADVPFVETICQQIEESALKRGTGIAKRSPEYIAKKMLENKAIVAFTKSGDWAGFCYIETWSHGKFAANSGLIVHPDFRKEGLAKRIKEKAFDHSRKMFPNAKLFGLTTSLPVMKINSDLGYEPVVYSELTEDEDFWKGCASCVNYSILMSKNKTNCICTAMLFDPKEQSEKRWNFIKKSKVYERLVRLKRAAFLKFTGKKAAEQVSLQRA
ncbi:GNAT family N-acetyltransferase [Imperialibacter roseus]|jgi:N-acetylglutamate synthase-like GNAT family acetyltransferase|uniref:GNAT family N-acetyltransferase n=1 Tax=Imperialibacter roseus TaxID=1324217 RepID=A0ABZ0ITE6_9BACT|nr:GNAT family N-acetyltransferase [Imperialibacter roseus]WOK07670.1 GNAT family N-acetyltransferase [Imperialibacter roseus]